MSTRMDVHDAPRSHASPHMQVKITRHYVDKNMRDIWDEICKTMEESTVAESESYSIFASLASNRPNPSEGWNSSQQSFLLHFADQAEQCKDMSDAPHPPRTVDTTPARMCGILAEP
jgi:hypothetical protein